jgi:hypothetical protein
LAGSKDKVARLKAAGLITTDRLPAEYRKVLEDMRETDIEGILLLKKRLDAAEKKLGKTGKSIEHCMRPPL